MSKFLSKLLLGKTLRCQYQGVRQPGARKALLTLSFINLLNFADRYVLSAVKTLIQEDLHLTDFETSLPGTGMVVVYMIFAVLFGILSDKNIMDRRIILSVAIIFWSAATSFAGFSRNLTDLIILRSLVGIGEAAYGTIAPPIVSDFYPDVERNIAYAIYYLAIPVGGAFGFGIGAVIGSLLGWRAAFYIIGVPGAFVAMTVLAINNPYPGVHESAISGKGIRGRADMKDSSSMENHLLGNSVNDSCIDTSDSSSGSSSDSNRSKVTRSCMAEMKLAWDEVITILSNKHYLCCVLGCTASNFALGGLADWFPTFLVRYAPGATIASSGLITGAATIIGGILGNILGAKVSDYYVDRKVKSAYFLIPALFTIPGGIFLFLAINIHNNLVLLSFFIIISEIAIWTQLAPISTISISVIPPHLRARSCGLLIFFQHILGDIISPPIIGAISDKSGLLTALQICWIVTFMSGLVWFAGIFTYVYTFDDTIFLFCFY